MLCTQSAIGDTEAETSKHLSLFQNMKSSSHGKRCRLRSSMRLDPVDPAKSPSGGTPVAGRHKSLPTFLSIIGGATCLFSRGEQPPARTDVFFAWCVGFPVHRHRHVGQPNSGHIMTHYDAYICFAFLPVATRPGSLEPILNQVTSRSMGRLSATQSEIYREIFNDAAVSLVTDIFAESVTQADEETKRKACCGCGEIHGELGCVGKVGVNKDAKTFQKQQGETTDPHGDHFKSLHLSLVYFHMNQVE